MDVPTFTANALRFQDKPAVIMADTGKTLTYSQLNVRSNQAAHLLRSLGIQPGDTLAMCVDNSPEFFPAACAALRSGLRVVPVSTRLTVSEIAFIVRDSGAKGVVVSEGIGDAYFELRAALADTLLIGIGQKVPGVRSWEEELARQPTARVADEQSGGEMLYSSGTTGRPKGIVYHGVGAEGAGASRSAVRMFKRIGLGPDTRYLSPAPLYHAAPFGWGIGMLEIGATIVVMPYFDAETALALIERYRINISHWVPTHFSRMLKLPSEFRERYDVSSLKVAVHAAAPCPVPVKRAMIDWWGPIILEYFGSSEQTALTLIHSEEWLTHPGSVGKCYFGQLHICNEKGEPLPVGMIGEVYSEGGMEFSYHNDPEKTANSRNRDGWTTVGDIGYMDDEGYLYLTDRKNFTIISGGVNIYPQEIENLLITHPRIADAAVIGVPDSDLGEMVTAIVQPLDERDATEAFKAELRDWMRPNLSSVKIPKRIEFRSELPRLPTGKMAKLALRAAYAKADSDARQPY
jgi:acyl-CoA synthetase (AMP-forming)/AMP-acid ligase II